MARTALVTGGNRGIGLEACRQLARLGLDVLLGARDPEEGERAARALAGEGLAARVERLDVTRPEEVADCAERVRARGQRVEVLVNNAGVYPGTTVLGSSEAELREALAVNFLGAVWTCRAFAPAMARSGWGRIVNVSSGYGSFAEGLEGPAPYSLSKAALNALTLKLAGELPGAVKVNAACPGWVRTRMGGAGAELGVEEGADTIVWLATLPDDGPSGGFFRRRERIAW